MGRFDQYGTVTESSRFDKYGVSEAEPVKGSRFLDQPKEQVAEDKSNWLGNVATGSIFESEYKSPGIGEAIGQLGESIVPEAVSPENKHLQTLFGKEGARGAAFVGNFARGLAKAPFGIASWKADMLTDPKKGLADMGQMLRDGLATPKEVYDAVKDDGEARKKLIYELENHPVEKAFEVFLPIAMLLGVRKLGKGVAGKATEAAYKTPAAKPFAEAVMTEPEKTHITEPTQTNKIEDLIDPETRASIEQVAKKRAEKAGQEYVEPQPREIAQEVAPEPRGEAQAPKVGVEKAKEPWGGMTKDEYDTRPLGNNDWLHGSSTKGDFNLKDEGGGRYGGTFFLTKDVGVAGHYGQSGSGIHHINTSGAKLLDVTKDANAITLSRKIISEGIKVQDDRVLGLLNEKGKDGAVRQIANEMKSNLVESGHWMEEEIGYEAVSSLGYDGIKTSSEAAVFGTEKLKVQDYPDLAKKYQPEKVTAETPQAVKDVAAKDKWNRSKGKSYEEIQAEDRLASGFKIGTTLGETLSNALKRDRKRQGAPTVHLEKEPFKPGVSASFRTPSNLIGAIPGQTPKDVTAAKAIRTMNLTERDMRIDAGQNAERINNEVFRNIDKSDKGKGDKKWSKIVDAIQQTPEEIAARTDLHPNTKKAVVNTKTWLDEQRKRVIEDKREDIRSIVEKEVEQQYREASGLKGKKLTEVERATMKDQIETELKNRVPDDWGIEDYLSHIFPGQFLVRMETPAGKMTIGSATTKAEAMRVVAKDYSAREGVRPTDYFVERKTFLPPSELRVSTGRKWRLIQDIAEKSDVSKAEIVEMLTGEISTKRGRQKWNPFLIERKGAEGYSTDLPFILETYNASMARWRHISKMNREVQPLIEELRANNKPDLANYVENTLMHTWGQRSPASIAFDNSLEKIPILKNMTKPFALERWTGYVKGAYTTALLKWSPKFHFLNRLQSFQTTMAISSAHDAKFWRRQLGFTSAEQSLLDKYGVKYITGGKIEEAGKPMISPALREKVRKSTAGIGAAETFNQEHAWLTMFDEGIKRGLPEVEAADYAFLRGNVFTQFIHLKSDTPPMFRNPVTTTLMPFKRFQIKSLELLYDRVRQGDISGVSKFLGSNILIGGVKTVTGKAGKLTAAGYLAYRALGGDDEGEAQKLEYPAYIELETYNKIKDAVGEEVANAIAFGLPSLVGLDLSYSVQLLDMPFGSNMGDAIARFMLGPVYSVGTGTGAAMEDLKGPEPSALLRGIRNVSDKVAGLRWIRALEMVMDGDYDFKTASGKKKFESDLQEVIVFGMGGRPVTAGTMDMTLSAMRELKESWDTYADRAVMAYNSGGDEAMQKVLDQWNHLWPDAPMTGKYIRSRIKRRQKDEDKTAIERFEITMPKALKRLDLNTD